MRPVMVSPRSDGDQRFRGAFPLGGVQHRSRAVIKLSRVAGPKMAAAQSPLVLEIAYRRLSAHARTSSLADWAENILL